MEIQFNEDGTPFAMWDDTKIEVERCPITETFYKEKAETELRETPEIVEKALQELRELLKDEKSLNMPIDSDDFLIRFLRPCKFYAQSAFKKIQLYYKFRQTYPSYCKDMMPSSIRAAFDFSIISILAPRDQHGRRIVLIETGKNWNARDCPAAELFRGMQLALEAALTEPRTQVSGVNVILDMKGLSFSQVLQFTPSFAKITMYWVQECIPIRIKSVHILNQPYIFNMAFALFKPFLNEKLRNRVYFHGNDMESLKRYIDGRALRKRHGGTLPEVEVTGEITWKMMSYYEEDFKLSNSYGYTTTSTTNDVRK